MTTRWTLLRRTTRGENGGGFLVAIGATLFGCVVFLAKLLSRGGVSVPMALAIRFGICSLLLVALVAALKLRLRPTSAERRGLVMAAALYAVEAALFFAALHHGQAPTVTLLFFTYPVFTFLVLLAMGRGLPGKLVVGSAVAVVVGAGLVGGSAKGLSIEPLGIVLVLISAAGYTGYLLIVHGTLRNSNSLTTSMWITGGVALTLLAVAIMANQTKPPASGQEWLELAGMGSGTAAGIVCVFVGLRELGPVRTSILSTMEPLTVALLSFLILGDPVLPGTIIGGLLILAGAVIAARAHTVPSVQIP